MKSGGKTRRAAKMNTLKDWHPDIEDFIEAKTIEEKKPGRSSSKATTAATTAVAIYRDGSKRSAPLNTRKTTAFSITDYVFRWMDCEFIQGYRQATSPDHGQGELPLPEIAEMEQSALNRPVRELNLDSSQTRVNRALGSAYMGVICSHCGSDKVIRAGACGVCTQCGTSQGCG